MIPLDIPATSQLVYHSGNDAPWTLSSCAASTSCCEEAQLSFLSGLICKSYFASKVREYRRHGYILGLLFPILFPGSVHLPWATTLRF